MGIIMLMLLSAALVVAWVIAQDNAVQREETWISSVAFAILAFGILYVLFTLPGTLRRLSAEHLALHAREPATRSAVVGPAPVESRPVHVVEGIGPAYGERLETIGVRTLRDLRVADPDILQEATGANGPTVSQWKAMAHLLALDAVDAQAAELLVRGGVDTVKRLAAQDPKALHRKLRTFNAGGDRRIMPEALRLEDVRRWVAGARGGDFRYTAGAARSRIAASPG